MWGLILFAAVAVGQVEPGAPASAQLSDHHAAPADAPPNAAEGAVKLEVQRLVRRLNADKLDDRNAAEEQLTKMGGKVLDLLPDINPLTPPEVKQRLERVRQAVQRQIAEAAGQASTVTLKGILPVGRVLTEFEKQTGNKIIDQRGEPADQSTVAVDFDKTPFWKALDQVLDQARLTVYPFGEQKAIVVQRRPPGEEPRAARACYRGPFRFEPVRVVAECDLRSPERKSLQVMLETAWEPRLSPIVIETPMNRVEAVDDRGQRVAPAVAEASPEINLLPGKMAEVLPVPLALPSRGATRLERLKGSLKVLLPSKNLCFRFKDLDKAAAAAKFKEVDQRQAGVTVVLSEVRRNDTVWEIRIRVRYDDAGEALQSHRNWILENEAKLISPEGKAVPYDGTETLLEEKNQVGLLYVFALPGPLTGYQFEYTTPGMILPTEVEYEVKDVRLP